MDVRHLHAWTREDLLYFAPAFAVLSLGYVSVKRLNTLWIPSPNEALNGKAPAPAPEEFEEIYASVDTIKHQGTVREMDGLAIVLFRLLRTLSVLALLSLEVFKTSIGDGSTPRLCQSPLYIYLAFLAIASIVASPQWRDVASRQLAVLLFADFAVYFALDAWPYATRAQTPLDPAADPVTWARLVLLALSGVAVPLVMPRPFRAMTLGAQPSLEDTASLLSRYTYSFLDAIVLYAYRMPDVTVADMPPVPERGKIETLARRALEALDPVRVGRRHIIWGVLRVWGKDYVLLTLWMSLHSITEFAGPYGMKNLLAYLETGVLSHNLHPWVWIFVLAIGPVISACLFTQFLYVGTRVIVENTSVFTYLAFHHSLRIRLRSDALDKDKDVTEKAKDKVAKKSVDASAQESVTPATNDAEIVAGLEDERPADIDVDAATTGTTVSDAETTLEGGHAQEKTGHLVGKINNLITTDLNAIANSHSVVMFPTSILQLVVSIAFLFNLLGWSAVVGLAVLLVFSPAPAYVGKLMANVQQTKMGATDKRVQAVSESLGVLRMIKLFAWESFMLKKLTRHRDEELARLKHFGLLQAVMNCANQTLPLLSKLTVLAFYTLVMRGELSASRIFSALMIFDMMQEQLFNVMYIIPQLLKAKVSYDRYSDFLNTTELLSEGNALFDPAEEDEQVVAPAKPDKDTIGFKACTFSWDSFRNRTSGTPRTHHYTRKQFNLCFDGEVTFKRDNVNLIVGPTASGKTSVLMALLGEMYYKPHGIGSWYSLPRDGGIAYAAQETWVLNETIRENILFGEPYDEARYKKVLRQCALERDLGLWEAGDLTEVGEKGLTLSGGQKARVTFARALYSSASILLLDDVLAALDVHTAKWIVSKALQGDLIQGRTVLLVTHNIALTAPVAEHVVVLGRHGNVSAQGPVSEVLKKDPSLRAQVEKEREEVEHDIEDKLDEEAEAKDSEGEKKSAGKLVVAEEKAMGRVELTAIMLYIGSVGGRLMWTLILSSKWAGMLLSIFQTWFLGYWSNQYATHPSSEVPALKYLTLYAFINLANYITDFSWDVLWVFRSLRASKIIHFRLLESIFTSKFRWLDVTPIGRIVTRCTQDMSTIDGQLGEMAAPFMSITVKLICLFFSAVLMAGWYALIPGLIVGVLGGLLGRVYLKCQICVRREMSNAKAPVMTQVGTALAGLPSIRAYNAQNLFHSELRKRIDIYTRTSLTFYDINRWVSIRVDSLGAIFVGVMSAYLVYGGRVEAGFVGFTLTVVLSFTRLILFWVRLYNLLEIQANSLERMLEFMRIDHEPKSSESGKPPAYWPSTGDLRVENLCARYSDDSPDVLQDISFKVKSGQRIGVVGRTGAGKSSVALALLRAIKTTGKVYYDGLATDEMNLEALRSNITLIPQQPELIQGTLRENLDPFEQHDDAALNDALRAAGFFNMKEIATNKSDGEQADQADKNDDGAEQISAHAKIGLDTMVESGGTNFSLGQRQIIALARAIVRRSKLLILDEATAAIDKSGYYDTDSAIQKTLRTEFSKDTTFITIAHRLQTIIDYDQIMVLDAGRLVEYDSPKTLLKKEKGMLRALVDESDDRDTLLKLAGV